MKLACCWMKGPGGNPFFSHANIKYADTTAFTNQIIHLISILTNTHTHTHTHTRTHTHHTPHKHMRTQHNMTNEQTHIHMQIPHCLRLMWCMR